MKKNILIVSSQEYSSILAKKMQDEGEWNIRFCLTGPSNEAYVKENFKGIYTQNYIDSIKGVPLIDFPLEFNLELLDSVNLDFITAISLLDRNDSNTNSFSYKDRLAFCNERISFWGSILKKLEIDSVLFEEEPHQCSSYILYKVAQHLDISTPMVIRTIGNLGVIPTLSFEHKSEKLMSLYSSAIKTFHETKNFDLAPALSNYLNKLSGNYDLVLQEHLWNQLETYEEVYSKENTSVKFLTKFTKKVINKLINIKKIQIESDQKEAKKSFSNSKLSYFKYHFFKLKTTFKKKSLYKKYKELACFPDNGQSDYVLCALQYQPEKSTCPLGGKFNDQRLMIQSLRQNLSDDVIIYVKEHPSQFIYDHARYGEYFRDEAYYESITSIPNVKLLDMRTDIFDMIDDSLFVASVTGTICWEAVNRQKEALCFGYSWMLGCEGIFEIKEEIDIKRAIHRIVNKRKSIELVYVYLFAKTIYDLGFSVAVGGIRNLKHKNISPNENALLLQKAMHWLMD